VELAARLAFRLQRLQAMREAAAHLMARNLVGRDVFTRGAPEGIRVVAHSQYQASLYDLLSVYATRRAINSAQRLKLRVLPVWSVTEARERLERLVGRLGDWLDLNALLIEYLVDPALRPSVIASSFTATLEMVREGRIELRQARHFEPLYLRARAERAPAPDRAGARP
jgi:segregation and condensation protein A